MQITNLKQFFIKTSPIGSTSKKQIAYEKKLLEKSKSKYSWMPMVKFMTIYKQDKHVAYQRLIRQIRVCLIPFYSVIRDLRLWLKLIFYVCYVVVVITAMMWTIDFILLQKTITPAMIHNAIPDEQVAKSLNQNSTYHFIQLGRYKYHGRYHFIYQYNRNNTLQQVDYLAKDSHGHNLKKYQSFIIHGDVSNQWTANTYLQVMTDYNWRNKVINNIDLNDDLITVNNVKYTIIKNKYNVLAYRHGKKMLSAQPTMNPYIQEQTIINYLKKHNLNANKMRINGMHINNNYIYLAFTDIETGSVYRVKYRGLPLNQSYLRD